MSARYDNALLEPPLSDYAEEAAARRDVAVSGLVDALLDSPDDVYAALPDDVGEAGYSETYLIGYVLDELRQRAEDEYDNRYGRRR